jgi:hypothetical protein
MLDTTLLFPASWLGHNGTLSFRYKWVLRSPYNEIRWDAAHCFAPAPTSDDRINKYTFLRCRYHIDSNITAEFFLRKARSVKPDISLTSIRSMQTYCSSVLYNSLYCKLYHLLFHSNENLLSETTSFEVKSYTDVSNFLVESHSRLFPHGSSDCEGRYPTHIRSVQTYS